MNRFFCILACLLITLLSIMVAYAEVNPESVTRGKSDGISSMTDAGYLTNGNNQSTNKFLKIPVEGVGFKGAAGISFNALYDEDSLDFIKYDNAGTITEAAFFEANAENGRLAVAIASASGIEKNEGMLGSFIFEITNNVDKSPSSIRLTALEVISEDLEEMEATAWITGINYDYAFEAGHYYQLQHPAEPQIVNSKGYRNKYNLLSNDSKSSVPTVNQVSITQVNATNFPDILFYATITDANGDHVTGITESDILVFEQSSNEAVPTQESNVSVSETSGGSAGVTIELAMDCSGSMGGSEQDVVASGKALLSNMTANDFAGVIFFENSSYVKQSIIGATIDSDQNGKSDLEEAVEDYYSGGGTSLYDGICMGADELCPLSGIRALVVFTDGKDTASSVCSMQSAIERAQNCNIPVYTIGIGGINDSVLIDIAEQTNGEYFPAPSAAQMGEIYNQIHGGVGQYEIAYSTHNDQRDGTTRTITLQVDNGQAPFPNDTAQYDICDAPEIVRTQETIALSNQSQVQGLSLDIEATITDDTGVVSANLYYRIVGQGSSYTRKAMNDTGGDMYSATIDGSEVIEPGIEYYISASDGMCSSTSPAVDPTVFPHHIPVMPNYAPIIDHTPITQAASDVDLTINAEVTDTTDNVALVNLYYRKTGTFHYTSVEMIDTGSGLYEASVPATTMIAPGVDYYISAYDNYGLRTDHGTINSPHQIIIDAEIVITLEDNLSGNPGEDLFVPILVSNMANVAGFNFSVGYDSSVLTVNSVEKGTDFDNYYFDYYDNGAGTINIAGASASGQPLTGIGNIVIINFHINSNSLIGDTTTVEINNTKLFNDNYIEIPSRGAPGDILISCLNGDVDGDGLIGLVDVILALQLSIGQIPNVPVFLCADINGDGVIDVAEAIYILQIIVGIQTATTYDFNMDNKPDILYRHPNTGEIGVWLMDGTAENTWEIIADHGPDWDIQGVGDFNRDGSNDLLYKDSNGDLYVWLMNGTVESYRQPITDQNGQRPANHGALEVRGIADFNKDTHVDVLYREPNSGDITLWLMNGTTETTQIYIGNDGTDWDIGGVGDFNRDGSLDILYGHSGGNAGVWFMNGTSKDTWQPLTDIYGYQPANHRDWDIKGVADYNNDGHVDVIYRKTITGDVGMWLMDDTTEITWRFINNHGSWDIR